MRPSKRAKGFESSRFSLVNAFVAGTPPTVTAVAGPRCAPVIVIVAPPAKHSSVGVMPPIDAGHDDEVRGEAKLKYA
jgi:hypothetical protein